MARWIDMTDAQKANLAQREAAKERAKIVANPAYIIKAFDRIEAEAAAILAEGGRFAEKNAARALEEKQPYFDKLARLGIALADIGVAA